MRHADRACEGLEEAHDVRVAHRGEDADLRVRARDASGARPRDAGVCSEMRRARGGDGRSRARRVSRRASLRASATSRLDIFEMSMRLSAYILLSDLRWTCIAQASSHGDALGRRARELLP